VGGSREGGAITLPTPLRRKCGTKRVVSAQIQTLHVNSGKKEREKSPSVPFLGGGCQPQTVKERGEASGRRTRRFPPASSPRRWEVLCHLLVGERGGERVFYPGRINGGGSSGPNMADRRGSLSHAGRKPRKRVATNISKSRGVLYKNSEKGGAEMTPSGEQRKGKGWG